VIFAGVSNVGLKRSNNEDAFYIPNGEGRSIMIVADGMGGHNAGEIASGAAAEAVADYLNECPLEELQTRPEALMEAAIRRANVVVKSLSCTRGDYSGMGTTMTAVLFLNGRAIIGHVGDSRSYHFTDGALHCITTDHSLVQELLDMGEITDKEAADHPQRNVITRALGLHYDVGVDVFNASFTKGDILLLCSDGLTGHLSDEEIERLIVCRKMRGECLAQQTLDEICNLMMRAALSRGGTDNITIALAHQNQGGGDCL
jgi:serine/threonine protein phosphatase PrpC